MKLLKIFLNHSLIDIKLDKKHQSEVVISSLIMFIYCIANVIKQIRIVLNHIWTHHK